MSKFWVKKLSDKPLRKSAVERALRYKHTWYAATGSIFWVKKKIRMTGLLVPFGTAVSLDQFWGQTYLKSGGFVSRTGLQS